MTEARAHPFSLIFGELAPERFPVLHGALGTSPSFDTFLMAEPAITLMRELRPEEGLEGGGHEFLSLVYAAYRFWASGETTVALSKDATIALCGDECDVTAPPATARYIQVAPRLLWGALDEQDHHEPLDGWFVIPTDDGILVVALFGVHPERPGLSVITVSGEYPVVPSVRDDGSARFAPTMSGGELAGLYAVASLGELLLIAWRGSAQMRMA